MRENSLYGINKYEVIKIGLDWCLKNKPKKPEFASKIEEIKQRMNELNEYDWKKNPEVKAEYDGLKIHLAGLEIVPEETVGMKRLKELNAEERQKAFEKYAVPRIKDAKKGNGHEGFNNHWKDMTFERWVKENLDTFLDWDMPEIMKDMPRVIEPFSSLAGWMSFRGKCVGYCELIPSHLKEEAYTDKTPEQMLHYANRLEKYAKDWEKDNAEILGQVHKYEDKLQEWRKDNDWTVTIGMDDKKKEAHQKNMKKKYGDEFTRFREVLNESGYYDYKILIDAITWLRFWAERGHGMWAWS